MENSFEFIIRKKYSTLRKSEKKVADVILDENFDVIHCSIESLALMANVSQPTIIRFANAFDLKGFKDLKKMLIAEKTKENKSFSASNVISFSISPEDKLIDTPAKVINTHVKHFQDMLKNLSPEKLVLAVEAIITAKNIVIFAVENSASVADDLRTKLTYMGFNIIFYSDPYLQKISAKNITNEDVAIGISYTGFSTITVDALATAKKKGAKTISISNIEKSIINDYADIVLCTGNEQYLYGNAIFSRCTQIALIDMIYTGILLTDYPKYSKIIENNAEETKSFAYSND